VWFYYYYYLFQLRLVDVEHQRHNHLTQHKQHNHLPNLHVNDCRRHRYALQVCDYYFCIILATCTFYSRQLINKHW
jgi:hypothetical protein